MLREINRRQFGDKWNYRNEDKEVKVRGSPYGTEVDLPMGNGKTGRYLLPYPVGMVASYILHLSGKDAYKEKESYRGHVTQES